MWNVEWSVEFAPPEEFCQPAARRTHWGLVGNTLSRQLLGKQSAKKDGLNDTIVLQAGLEVGSPWGTPGPLKNLLKVPQ